jgi:hypothetical protein
MFWRKNFDLNFGGVAGALIFLGTTIAIFCLISNAIGRIPQVGSLPFVISTAAGGMFGNWLWNFAFPD